MNRINGGRRAGGRGEAAVSRSATKRVRWRTAVEILLIAAMTAVLTGCAGSKLYKASGQEQSISPYAARFLRGEAEVAEFRASGNLTLSQGGQKLSGAIDIHVKAGGFFRTQIYSPFGSIVTTAEADDFKGYVKAGKDRIDFTYDDAMNYTPFPFARRFTYGEFIKTVAGGSPHILRQLPLHPDTVVHGKREVTAVWITDTLVARVRTSPQTGALTSVSFEYGAGEGFVTVRMRRFQNGSAREILIKDIDGNYISIKYDTVRVVRVRN